MFHVGQKVVCIDDRIMKWRLEEVLAREVEFPVEGNIYTVRDIMVRSCGIGLYLEEIRNPMQNFGIEYVEPCFLEERFRPLSPVEEVRMILEEESITIPAK